MTKKVFTLISIIIVFNYNLTLAQNNSASKILDEISKKFEKVNDYSVEAKIKVNIELLKVPERNAKIFFKKPDKVKMESDGFALLPKQGMNFSPNLFLTDKYESIYIRKEKIDNIDYDVVKIIPLSDTSNILLSTLWIDSKNLVIKKANTVTKKTGMLAIEFKYDQKLIKYSLPSEIKFIFNPEENSSEKKVNTNQSGKIVSRTMKGNVIVNYSNYKVNTGMSDDIFEKK